MCNYQRIHEQTADESSIETFLQKLLKDAVTDINNAIDSEIKSNGYDPMAQVTHGSGSAGSKRVLFCSFGASYSYSVGDMIGLSSLAISSFKLSDFRTTDNTTGVCNCNMTLNVGDMSAQLSGHGSVDACGIDIGAGLNGSVAVSASSAAPSATLSASYSLDPLSGKINSITVNSINLNLGAVSVHIDSGLPWPLDDLVDAIASAITNDFRGKLEEVLNPVIQNTLNNALTGVMPIST